MSTQTTQTAHEEIEIKAILRTPGKRVSRSMRSQKLIPSVVYGPKVDSHYFAITELEATRYSARAFDNSIFILKSEDTKLNGMRVLKKNISIHPVHRQPTHFDFYAPDMTQTVKVAVEINYEGRSRGEKNGGIFQALRRDVEVECLPTDIPSSLTVNIEPMELGDVLHVSHITPPHQGIKILTPPEEPMASVVAAKKEAEAPPASSTSANAAPSGTAAPSSEEKK